MTAAVSPTPEDPLPVVLTDSSATFMTARSSWDLATPGSPTSKQLMSPLKWCPLARFLSLHHNQSRKIMRDESDALRDDTDAIMDGTDATMDDAGAMRDDTNAMRGEH